MPAAAKQAEEKVPGFGGHLAKKVAEERRDVGHISVRSITDQWRGLEAVAETDKGNTDCHTIPEDSPAWGDHITLTKPKGPSNKPRRK